MKPKLSCTDFSFPKLSRDQAFGTIALLGFRGVDIGLFEGHEDLKPSRELRQPSRSGAALKARLDSHGLQASDLFLQIHAGFEACAINHPDPKIRQFARERFTRGLDYATALGSEHLTILPGVAFQEISRKDSLKLSADELAWRIDAGKKAGIQVAVEPHVGSLVDTPERTQALTDLTPGLGLTLDYSHFTRAGIPDERIEPLLAHATHLHARCARRGRLQCSMKENTIHFQNIARSLANRRFKGWIALEYVWIDWEHCNEVDVISETLILREQLLTAAKQRP
jgi:sugar phosphate isomerase/epimerase